MKKKIISLCLALVLCLSLAAFASAENVDFMLDYNGKLKDEAALNALAQEIYDSYGIAAAWCYTADMNGMQGMELTEYLYDNYVGRENGLILLHAPEVGKLFFWACGSAEFLNDHFETLLTAYDAAQTYDSGVRDYLNVVYSLLEETGLPKRDLVLISDDSAGAPAYDPADSEGSGELLTFGEPAVSQPVSPAPQLPEEKLFKRVCDEAGVLSAAKLEALNALADEVSGKYGCDVAVALVDHVQGSSIEANADDFYDYNGYGYGADDNGIMLYIAVKDRQYTMTTHAYGVHAFTDYGLEALENGFIGYLRNSDWGGAAERFIKDCSSLLAQAAAGKPYDYYPQESSRDFSFGPEHVLICVILGFLAGCIPVAGMKRGMKSVRSVQTASDYVRRGSFELTHSNDIFLRRSVNRVPRPKPQERSGGGSIGGGSSVHISSSGRTHGGRSGRF